MLSIASFSLSANEVVQGPFKLAEGGSLVVEKIDDENYPIELIVNLDEKNIVLERNEDELAKTLFPSDFDGMDYRGRGLIHLTHEGTYKSYKDYSENDVVSNPKLLESSPSLAVDSVCRFWSKFAKINTLADSDNLSALTYKVNTARLDMAKRGVIQKNALAYLKKKITGCVK
ncbi:hypothetical protein [Pantoea endophytica]